MGVNYRPRNDYVLIRVIDVEKEGRIFMPQQSLQGKRYQVVAVGPEVEDLQKGDWCFMTGQQKIDWDFLPNSKDLLVIRQGNIMLVVEENDE